MSRNFLCMDVGGTNTRVGVVDERLEVLGSAIERTPELAAKGIGVFTLNGKMLDVAFLPGAERVIQLAKASGLYKGDL